MRAEIVVENQNESSYDIPVAVGIARVGRSVAADSPAVAAVGNLVGPAAENLAAALETKREPMSK